MPPKPAPDPAPVVPYRVIRCPGCGGDSIYAVSNPWRPFCSERCRRGDLGAWSSEGYRVASQPDPGDEESPALPDRG